MIEPRKGAAEADAVRKAEGNIGLRETEGRLGRGHRAGHARKGILETWEISLGAVARRYGGTKETKGSRRLAMEMGGGWALEVDIRKYFDTIDHEQLRAVLRQRIGDGVVLQLIGKWLNAGHV